MVLTSSSCNLDLTKEKRKKKPIDSPYIPSNSYTYHNRNSLYFTSIHSSIMFGSSFLDFWIWIDHEG
ncbi:hypothetical protein C1645_823315 [Glomus cerebriforme]|uniref:Uncharacterized protein n=1 Tax=Glomus cerebriforme TaxID=658196 RepID=A0A397SWY4_9GLOM|nr:hypothetical protein C1645_823315 [Glomus cerebriforme]